MKITISHKNYNRIKYKTHTMMKVLVTLMRYRTFSAPGLPGFLGYGCGIVDPRTQKEIPWSKIVLRKADKGQRIVRPLYEDELSQFDEKQKKEFAKEMSNGSPISGVPEALRWMKAMTNSPAYLPSL